jgi:hypothetical protein
MSTESFDATHRHSSRSCATDTTDARTDQNSEEPTPTNNTDKTTLKHKLSVPINVLHGLFSTGWGDSVAKKNQQQPHSPAPWTFRTFGTFGGTENTEAKGHRLGGDIEVDSERQACSAYFEEEDCGGGDTWFSWGYQGFSWRRCSLLFCTVWGKVVYFLVWCAALHALYSFHCEFTNVSNVNAMKLSAKWHSKCTTPPFDNSISERCDVLMRWTNQGYTVNVFRKVWEDHRNHIAVVSVWVRQNTNLWGFVPRLCSDLCWSQIQLLEMSLLSDIVLAGPVIVVMLVFVCISMCRGPLVDLVCGAVSGARGVRRGKRKISKRARRTPSQYDRQNSSDSSEGSTSDEDTDDYRLPSKPTYAGHPRNNTSSSCANNLTSRYARVSFPGERQPGLPPRDPNNRVCIPQTTEKTISQFPESGKCSGATPTHLRRAPSSRRFEQNFDAVNHCQRQERIDADHMYNVDLHTQNTHSFV